VFEPPESQETTIRPSPMRKKSDKRTEEEIEGSNDMNL
jgi:hypothetical protein